MEDNGSINPVNCMEKNNAEQRNQSHEWIEFSAP